MIKRILFALALAYASFGPTATVSAAPTAALVAPTATNAIALFAAPVTNINLTNAITALTRTSSSGTVPMTWSIGLGANVHEGDYLHLIVYSDGTLSTIVQNVRHRLTNADLQTGATLNLAADGLTAPTATQYLKATIETTSPLGLGYSYTFATAITPTDAVAAMAWSGTDKTAGIALSDGNLFAVQNSAPGGVRSSRGVSTGKFYVEFVTAGGQINLYDSSASLTVDQERAADGGTPSAHAATYPSNTGFANYNTTTIVTPGYTGALITAGISGTTMTVSSVAVGSVAIGQYVAGPGIAWGTKITAGSGSSWTVNTSQTVADSGLFIVSGALIGMAVDATADRLWFATNNVWANSGDPAAGTGSLSIAGISKPVFPAINLQNGYRVRIFPGTPGLTTGFAFTPPSGFFAP